MSAPKPALLGGDPAFPEGLPFARPATPPLEAVVARLAPSYERGILTNGPLVREFEEAVAGRVGVEHAVAVSSCTAGLTLVLKARVEHGPVLLPSFTFSASAHAAAWNGLEPRFAECSAPSFQLDPADATARVDGAGALLAIHVFGAPCDAESLEALARRRGIPIVFDAAHALGAERGSRPVGGFGDAEVFSLSPTKPVVAGEGGVVTTGAPDLAEAVRTGRDYGNPGDYDTRFVGLSARMSELHAALALESLARLDEHLERRRTIAHRYEEALATIPGVRTQAVAPGDTSTYKMFTVAVDEQALGLSRDELVAGLTAEGVDTRCYFDPPVHRQRAYAHLAPADLPVTDAVASSVVSLPVFRDLSLEAVDRVAAVIGSLHAHAGTVRAAAGSRR